MRFYVKTICNYVSKNTTLYSYHHLLLKYEVQYQQRFI